MGEARQRGMRLIAGKVLQDRHSPDGVRDETEQSLIDTESLIRKWHGQDRLGYAITPRFAPSCSEAQLRGAGELAAKYPDVWIQSHVAENLDEIKWARELFPASRSYLSIYARLRPDARASHLRPLHPFRRRRPRADAQHRRGGGGEPHQQPVPGQRLLRLRRRGSHRLQVRPGQRRGRRHQLQPLPHHAGGLLRGPRGADQAGCFAVAAESVVAAHGGRGAGAGAGVA